MNPLFRPAFLLMNSISYHSKFALIASLFAIPLALLGGKTAWDSHIDSIQAEQNKQNVIRIRQATELIHSITNIRDSAVLDFLKVSPKFTLEYNSALKSTQQKIREMIAANYFQNQRQFLMALSSDLKNHQLAPGNEATRIFQVYDNASLLVDKATGWRTRLLNQFISLSSADPQVAMLINLVSNSAAYLNALSTTRTYGSYYVSRKYIESSGIQLLNRNYRHLVDYGKDFQIKLPEMRKLLDANKKYNNVLQLENISRILDRASQQLDQRLFQAVKPDGKSFEFYQSISRDINLMYLTLSRIFDSVNSILDTYQNQSKNRLYRFYMAVSILVILLIYLYIGFFTYVKRSFSILAESADRVAHGDYEDPIVLNSNDELQSLVRAMDNMRLELKQREDQLRLLGQTDGLTGLKNRKYFDEILPVTLANASRNQTPMSVVMVDVDHFKQVNDNYGHQTGDACLKHVSNVMLQIFKRKTDVVARFGGEEFVAILYGSGLEDALAQSETLRSRIESSPIADGDKILKVTASFGVASLDQESGFSADEVIAAADEQLYLSKKQGRNRVNGIHLNKSHDHQRKINDAWGSTK